MIKRIISILLIISVLGIVPIASANWVFVKGTDNAIWYRTLDNNTWGDWRSIGGIASSDPDASLMSVRYHWYIHVFVLGTDNALWTKELYSGLEGPVWHDWVSYGGILT